MGEKILPHPRGKIKYFLQFLQNLHIFLNPEKLVQENICPLLRSRVLKYFIKI